MGMSPKQRMEMDKKWRQYRLENVLTEEEKDAFDAPVPSQIKRFMTKFIDSLQKGNHQNILSSLYKRSVLQRFLETEIQHSGE